MTISNVKTIAREDERATLTPAADVYENDEGLLIICDLPGVAQSDADISFHEGLLTIDARRFKRTFVVPESIDASQISARLADGVLTLVLPKREEAKPRVIPIGG